MGLCISGQERDPDRTPLTAVKWIRIQRYFTTPKSNYYRWPCLSEFWVFVIFFVPTLTWNAQIVFQLIIAPTWPNWKEPMDLPNSCGVFINTFSFLFFVLSLRFWGPPTMHCIFLFFFFGSKLIRISRWNSLIPHLKQK